MPGLEQRGHDVAVVVHAVLPDAEGDDLATEERNRIDDEEIKALKEKGYQYYAMRGIPQDILAAELCEGVIKCAWVIVSWSLNSTRTPSISK